MTRSTIPFVGSLALQIGSALAAAPAAIAPDAAAAAQAAPALVAGPTGFVGTLDPALTTVCLVSIAINTF
jgi:hypothetical protein